ncbi:MAG: hypothetical protein KatS3mg027_0813 [Bacteroidia bacterium]|nr:MAG: hypothetical protein KatS3mg027_0813 [Bacteroidia bacterium]
MFVYPQYEFKTRKNKETDAVEIWDIARRQWVTLTPEEFVRQHLIHYLIFNKQFPLETIIVEKEIVINKLKKRFDIAVINKKQEFILVAECKAPTVNIDESVMQQVLIYNQHLKAQCLVLTNGLSQFVYEKINDNWTMVQDIKEYGVGLNE